MLALVPPPFCKTLDGVPSDMRESRHQCHCNNIGDIIVAAVRGSEGMTAVDTQTRLDIAAKAVDLYIQRAGVALEDDGDDDA